MSASIRMNLFHSAFLPIGVAKAEDGQPEQTGATIGEQWARLCHSATGSILEQPAEQMLSLARQFRCGAQLGVGSTSSSEQEPFEGQDRANLPSSLPEPSADVGIALKAKQQAQQRALDKLAANYAALGAGSGRVALLSESGGLDPSTPPEGSDWAIFNGLASVIGDTKSTMADPYGDIVKGLTDYFSDISSLMSNLSGWVKEGKDSSHMSINAKAICDKIDMLIGRYDGTDNPWVAIATIPGPAGEEPYQTVARWKKELGDALDVKVDFWSSSKGVRVYVNVDKLKKMRDSLKDHRNDSDWEPNAAQYQAWNAGFSGQKDGIQNDVQTLVEKYSRMNTTFDNMVKILSATMQAMLETEKAYLRI